MQLKLGIFFSLLSCFFLQPQEIIGGPIDFGLLDSVRNGINNNIVRPIYQIFYPEDSQSTVVPPMPTSTHLPSPGNDVAPSLVDSPAESESKPEDSEPNTDVETTTLPGDNVTGSDEIVTGTTEGRNIINAPSLTGQCPPGMKNINGRCRRFFGST